MHSYIAGLLLYSIESEISDTSDETSDLAIPINRARWRVSSQQQREDVLNDQA